MWGLGTYVMQRFLQLIPVLLIVSLLAFVLIHIAPGEPAQVLLGDFATQADIERLKKLEERYKRLYDGLHAHQIGMDADKYGSLGIRR